MSLSTRAIPRIVPFLFILAATTLVGQQKPTQPSGVITGVVVDGSSGEPVADAVVFLASTAAGGGGSQPRQVTDEKGRFAFIHLAGDRSYTISATGIGYLDGGYGRDAMPTDPLRPIALKPDEWVPDIRVSIWKPGAISGAVRDESGEPVVGVVVRALQRVRIQGRDDVVAGALTRTDDRGTYRIAGLSPGRYLVQVPSVQAAVPASAKMPEARAGLTGPMFTETLDLLDVDAAQRLAIGRYPVPPPPQNGKHFAYPPVFHPSTSSVADATAVVLKYGEDRDNIDVALAPQASVRVNGRVEGPPESMQSLTLRLLPAGLENLGFGAEVSTALVESDGRFTFINVPAGNYVIDAPAGLTELTSTGAQIGARRLLPGPPTSPVVGASTQAVDLLPGFRLTSYNFRMGGGPYSGRTTVSVGATDLNNVVVQMRRFATLTASIVLENDPTQPAVTAARPPFQIDPAGADASLAGAGRAGRGNGSPVTIGSIPAGQFLLHLQDGSPWMIKSVTWDGRDYTNTPFDTASTSEITGVTVTLTTLAPDLTGTVQSATGLKADATMVIAFPAEEAQWKNTGFWPARMKTATVSGAGAYRFSNLPAGSYLVVAISRAFTPVWRDPEFLGRIAASASRVTLSWGGKSSADLTATVVR